MEALRNSLVVDIHERVPHLREDLNFVNESLFVRCINAPDQEHASDLAYEVLGTFTPTLYSIEASFGDSTWLEELLKRAKDLPKVDFYPHMSTKVLEVLLRYDAIEIQEALPYCEWWDYLSSIGAIDVFPVEAVILDYVLGEDNRLVDTRRKVELLLQYGSPDADMERIQQAIDREIAHSEADREEVHKRLQSIL